MKPQSEHGDAGQAIVRGPADGHLGGRDIRSAGHACGHEHAGAPDATALVSARGLSLSRGGRALISRVDLDVHAGEIVTLIGPNGAGKTTLVKLILGILKPDSGVLLRPAATRAGYVPQNFVPDASIPMTAGGFLGLGNRISPRDISVALAEAGVARTFERQIATLSGGEMQRVLIARALLRDPNLLVLDEPASGVDYAGEADLYDLIGRLRESRRLGVLLVSHDLHVVMAKSDRVLCLNGHVCCSGRPESVAQHAEYVRLFGPEAARSLAVYHHHHDHRHDVSGIAHPVPEQAASGAAAPGKERGRV